MRCDVIVLGAGLAGLTAARDLAAAGVDVVVVEARARPGGRVEQTQLADGRLLQLGGEVVGPSHRAYAGLVAELGLTIEDAFTAVPGEDTWVLADGKVIGEVESWLGPADWAAYQRIEAEFAALAATVDPEDPWGHPEAARLDRLSIGAWLRDRGAPPSVVRARELATLALAEESIERTSLLSSLRKEAVAGAHGFYSYEVWECLKVAEGSATVPLRIAADLGHRIRYGAAAARVQVAAGGCTVTLATGERLGAGAVVCAMPVGPVRDLHVEGVSDARMDSLRRQRHALAFKAVFAYERSFWVDAGQNGAAYFEAATLGGTWEQRDGIISALAPAERIGTWLATEPGRIQDDLVGEMVAAFGPEAAEPQQVFLRRWATDPWAQGYITGWRPGDVTAVGPLHTTHEPPFYVCGSDQWVCGYMEGAVRTGRAAAAAALGVDHPHPCSAEYEPPTR